MSHEPETADPQGRRFLCVVRPAPTAPLPFFILLYPNFSLYATIVRKGTAKSRERRSAVSVIVNSDMKHSFFRRFLIAVVLLLIIGSNVCFAADPGTGTAGQLSFDALAGLRAGAVDGSIQYKYITQNVEDPAFYYFDSTTDEAMALSQGKIDFYFDMPQSFALLSEEYPELMAVPGLSVPIGSIGFCFAKTARGQELQQEMNEFLETIRESGELEEIRSYWFSAGDKENVTIPTEGENGTVRLVETAHTAPFGYIQNGGLAGYEPDLVARFCESYGYALSYVITNTEGALAEIQSGKSDIGASTFIATDERKEIMYFSDSTLELTYSVIMRRDALTALTGQDYEALSASGGDSGNTAGSDAQDSSGSQDLSASTDKTGVLGSLKESFCKTFLKEARWKMILQGLGTTLAITVLSALTGTFLGMLFYQIRRRKTRVLSGLLKLFSTVLSGTPVVVLLMITYYIIFGRIGIPGFWVAVITFSLNFSVSAASVFQSTIGAVDIGQTEAALALGYTRRQAFRKFVLPQAAQNFIPLLQGQTIALLKGTAVVGYIAVQDLTKMGDIIRSRTYEAFFPLLAIAAIYLLVAWLTGLFFEQIRRRWKAWK